jgi:prolyl 4-hydroxylase
MRASANILCTVTCVVICVNVFVVWHISKKLATETFANQPGKDDDVHAIPYDIITIPDVLTSEECDRLVEFANGQQLSESKVWSGNASNPDSQSEHRTSKQTWVEYDNASIGDIARKLRKKAAHLSGIYDPASFEKVQLAKYGTNGEYKQHYDSCTSKCPNNALCRIATLLVYLNEPLAGGDTVFPNMGITITPKKGAASFFFNVDSRDSAFPELNASLHAGMPVLEGEKYIANVWIMCPK